MTSEEQTAMSQMQQALLPQCLPLLDEFAGMLAGTPGADLDREINNLGHVLMLALKETAPDSSEALQYSLPFAFTEMLRQRMRGQSPTPAKQENDQ